MNRFRQDGCRSIPDRQAPLSGSEADEQARGEPDQNGSPEERVLQELHLSAAGTEWVDDLMTAR